MKNKKVKKMIEDLVNQRCGEDLLFKAKYSTGSLGLAVMGCPFLYEPFLTIKILGNGKKAEDWYYGDYDEE